MHVLVGGTPAVAELFYRGMAVAAVDAIVSDVVFVAKLDGAARA